VYTVAQKTAQSHEVHSSTDSGIVASSQRLGKVERVWGTPSPVGVEAEKHDIIFALRITLVNA